jgi:transposase-like protein
MKKIEHSKAVRASEEPIKPRRKYDNNFKREAVGLWLDGGKSARQVALELGIGENRLYAWHRKFGPATPGQQADLESQMQALRRENAQLRQQRDILKKTLGILSEPPSNGING